MLHIKKNEPFKLDHYCTRTERIARLGRAGSIYGKQWVSNLIVLAFVCIDMLCLKVLWNIVQTENPIFVYCLAFACAAALDIPLAIAAVCLKEYHQGLCRKQKKDLIVVLSVTVFVLAFVFSFGFRIVTRDLSFEIGTTSMLNDMLSATAETGTDTDDPSIWIAAVYNGMVPLLTSLSSFIISYFSSDPLAVKLRKLEKERVGLQANILDIEEALLEAGGPQDHLIGLIAREKDLFREFLHSLDQEGLRLKQLARVILMERLSAPDDITALSRSAAGLRRNKVADTAQELTGFVEGQIQDKKKPDLDTDKYVA